MSNSSTTTEAVLIEPIHPGEILMEDFIEDLGTTQNKLAKYFGTSAEIWMTVQYHYELLVERRKTGPIDSIEPLATV
ncbi:MAG TPA: addiction module antidote protein, HigA family [Candidatus Yaniella excrementigallinarum]|nr:addiction module antidote protein, HigA family [Candidatus Yaniella excrementigallinarum]